MFSFRGYTLQLLHDKCNGGFTLKTFVDRKTLSPANLLNHFKITYFISLHNQKGSICAIIFGFHFFPVCLFLEVLIQGFTGDKHEFRNVQFSRINSNRNEKDV